MGTSKATIKDHKKISSVWLIPFIAVLIGAWMIYQNINNQGILVQIEFSTAEALEEGKTKIKIKNVVVGKVMDIQLLDHSNSVLVKCRINKEYINLLRQDTLFWVVKPRIGSQGISGLGTLLSGAYIELAPGNSDAHQYEFTGLEKPPVTPLGTPGIHVTLNNKTNINFRVGTPIIFNGLMAGKVEHVFFNAQERTVYYDAFIESPYDEMITKETRFWQINGAELDISADGVHIETGTLETLLIGSIGFGIPKGKPTGEKITKREYFDIYPRRNAVEDSPHAYAIEYILLFNESIRGLKVHAPVEFRGIKIGQVVRTDINYKEMGDLLNKDTLVPILISVEPARLGISDSQQSADSTKQKMVSWLKSGLHAEISSSNLLIGSKFIDMVYVEPNDLDTQNFNGYEVIPTAASSFNLILQKVNTLLNKVNQLPFNNLITQAMQTLKMLKNAASEVKNVLSKVQQQELITSINKLLQNLNSITNSYSEGEPAQELLQANMKSLKQVLDQLQPLLLQLNQKSNSLIFNSPKESDIEPKRRDR